MFARASSPSVLSESALTQALQPLGITVEWVARTASTNTDLLTQARKRKTDLPSHVLRVAREQTAGRGRLERAWVSPPGAALTFSYGYRWPAPLQAVAGLPLVVGLALVQGLATLGAPVQLKWPNDILFAGRKLAGILVETVMQGNDAYVVVGIGLNLDLPSHVHLQIAQPVADLREAFQGGDAAALPDAPDFAQRVLLTIVPELQRQLQQFQAQGFAAFHSAWNAAHAYQDKPVQLLDGNSLVATGIARGVDEYGQLLLDTASGMRRLRSGDISLRPL